MGYFNDRGAFIRGNGNLSLGPGRDDGAYNATYPYAKDDITLMVSPAYMVSTTLPALTRASAGVYHRALAASTTHNVLIPMPGAIFRAHAGAQGAQGGSATPHGTLIKSVAVFYRVNTTTITSFDMTVQAVPHAAGSAIYTATDLPGTLTGDTLTAAANVYTALFTLTTPYWNNTADQDVNAEAVIVIPGSSTVDLLGAAWRVAVALY